MSNWKPAAFETFAGAQALARRLLGPKARVVFAKRNPAGQRYLVGVEIAPGRMGVAGQGASWADALQAAGAWVAEQRAATTPAVKAEPAEGVAP